MNLYKQERDHRNILSFLPSSLNSLQSIFNVYIFFIIFYFLKLLPCIIIFIATITFCYRSASQNKRSIRYLRENRKPFDIDMSNVARASRSGDGSLVSGQSGGSDVTAIRKWHRGGTTHNRRDGMEWRSHIEVWINRLIISKNHSFFNKSFVAFIINRF